MKVVSISKVVPYAGIPHAGGEYVRRHVAALLAAGHSVEILAPRDRRNIAALGRNHDDFEVHLFGPSVSLLRRLAAKLHDLVSPTRMPSTLVKAFGNDEAVARALRESDVVEVQWTEMMSVFMAVDASATVGTAPLLVAHDVLSQRERRSFDSLPKRRFVRRMVQALRVSRTMREEPELLRRAGVVATFSDKDARLIHDMAPSVGLCVIDPPLWDRGAEPAGPHRSSVRQQVVMVGAFARPENQEGALWFLRQIWPLVVAEVPSAEFVLVGSGPSPALKRSARRSTNARVTGFVESVEPFYATASVAVVPLRSGAGVKFKAIDALLRGVPLVATSVGAEGISDINGQHPFDVEDDAARFAGAILRALHTPISDVDRNAAAAWARRKYGAERFERRLQSLLADPRLRR